MKYMKPLSILIISLIFAVAPVAGESAPDGMVLIKGGCFVMGTNNTYQYEEGWPNHREKPAHKVCLDDFYIDPYETTQKKWDSLMTVNRSALRQDDLPVNHITWREAVTYCKKQGHRLPTEAEWEYAARAGTQTENFWGDGVDPDYVWYLDSSFRQLHPVGSKKPNPWGLYDMMGSVWEWTADWYSDKYYQNSPVKNPQGPEQQSWRVIRGASWVDEEKDIRSSIRRRGDADVTLDYWVGVRCAATPGK